MAYNLTGIPKLKEEYNLEGIPKIQSIQPSPFARAKEWYGKLETAYERPTKLRTEFAKFQRARGVEPVPMPKEPTISEELRWGLGELGRGMKLGWRTAYIPKHRALKLAESLPPIIGRKPAQINPEVLERHYQAGNITPEQYTKIKRQQATRTPTTFDVIADLPAQVMLDIYLDPMVWIAGGLIKAGVLGRAGKTRLGKPVARLVERGRKIEVAPRVAWRRALGRYLIPEVPSPIPRPIGGLLRTELPIERPTTGWTIFRGRFTKTVHGKGSMIRPIRVEADPMKYLERVVTQHTQVKILHQTPTHIETKTLIAKDIPAFLKTNPDIVAIYPTKGAVAIGKGITEHKTIAEGLERLFIAKPDPIKIQKRVDFLKSELAKTKNPYEMQLLNLQIEVLDDALERLPKPPTVPPVAPEVAPLKSIVEKAGAKWVGIQPVPKGESQVLFNDPVTKSTLALPLSKVTPEAVKARLAPPAIPKELEPLAREAKKYKSAEEFVAKYKPKRFNKKIIDVTTLSREQAYDLGGVLEERIFKDSNTIPGVDIPKNLVAKIKSFEADPREIKLLFGKDRVVSESAVRKLKDGILRGDEIPAVYIYKDRFVDGGNRVEATIRAGKNRIKVYDIDEVVKDAIQLGKDEEYRIVNTKNLTDIPQQLKSFYQQAIKITPKEPFKPPVPEPRKAVRVFEAVPKDVIDEIISGRTLMKPPVTTKTDWRETLGNGNYMRVFKGGKFASAPDEVASDLGMTENELRRAIANKLFLKREGKVWTAREPEPPTTVSKEEGGYIRIPTDEEFQRGITRLVSVVDIERPFQQIGAPKTGFSVKNYFSRRVAEREKGKHLISQLSKLKLSPKEYQDITYIAAQPTLFYKYSKELRHRYSPAYQLVRKYFDAHAKQLQKLEVIAEKWPQSLIGRLQEENLHIREVLRTAEAPRKTKLQNKLEANQASVDFLKQHKIQYVHLPIRVWLEDLFDQKPDKASRILSRFFGKRETVDIRQLAQTLQREGVIQPQDTDVRNIIAAYSNKIGRTYALSEIFINARKEGLIKPLDQAPETWVSPPARLVPELRGHKVHPAFMEYLEKHLKTVGKGYMLSRPMSYIKIMQFDNPLFLPAYDTYQGFWLGTMRTPKLPLYVYKAAKSILKKDPDYWLAWENGLFSQPYIPPFEDFSKEIDVLKETSFIKRGLKVIKQNTKIPLDLIYRPLWHMAWGGDRFIRMMSYHYLRRKGNTPFEASQMGALFHSDYASVPPRTRKIINKIFFTHTFKITMSKLYLSMLKSTGKVVINVARMRPSKARDRQLAIGLLALIGTILIRRKIMKSLGFKEQALGLRYYKEIVDEKGMPRELVVYLPSPDNIWLRYYHRWKTFPEDPEKLEGFFNRLKWDLHPLWLLAINMAQNRRPDGNTVYNPFDNKGIISKDILEFSAKSLIRVIRRIDDYDREEKEKALKAFHKDVGKLWTTIIGPTALIYTRHTKERRAAYKIRSLQSEFKRYFWQDPPKTIEQHEQRVHNLVSRMQEVIEDLEKEEKYKVKGIPKRKQYDLSGIPKRK